MKLQEQAPAEPRGLSAISKAIVVAPAPLGSGGLGSASAEAYAGLTAAGCETSFIGLQPHGRLTRLVRSRAFRRAFGNGPRARSVAREVRRAVPEHGWDLAFAVPGCLPLERGGGIRVLHQATRHPVIEWAALRTGERETGGRGDMSRAERRRRELEIERADLIHVTSQAVGNELLEAGVSPQKLVHSPYGVDLDHFRPDRKRDFPTIAFVGPLSLRKGIDAVAELARRTEGQAVVEVVGGPSCPWSRRIAEAAPFVRHRGSVQELLGTAHALVLPSRSDGFSYVVLEALACGTVPIVTPEVGAAEVVRRLDERLVVEHQGFAEEVAALLPRLDFAELSRRARILAEEFDRRRTSRALGAAVLQQAEQLETQRR